MRHAHRTSTLYTAALVGLAFLLLPLAAHAGPRQGPRASVEVATVCALDGTTFSVEVRVRDKTSGSAVAEVNAWSLEAVYKDRNARGRALFAFDPALLAEASGIAEVVGDGLVFAADFDLCLDGGIRPELDNARALNAITEVTYGPNGGTVTNQCSDDPATEDVIEPSGIPLSFADIAAIDALCQL